MSIVGVYRSVPSPHSDLYRYPRASDLCIEESKMNLPSGISSILSPPTDKAQHPTSAGENGGHHEINPSIAPPQPAGQFVTQLPKLDNIDPSLKPVSQLGGEHIRDRFAHQQDQVSQNWTGGDSTMCAPSGPIPPGRGPETVGEENDEDLAEEFSNGEEADGGHSKSGGDAGDDKKKTKRFRLTHNQTRFLMSEFTRQAHPDAAHRERLSREIPGLSPRQVQVWFQNRRAKLKRLTSQDRDRVLKSRALPEHFDRSQMLHQPYSSRPPSNTSPTSPTTSRSSFANGGPKPLAVSNIKTNPGEDYPVSPGSTASPFGNYANSPGLPEPFPQAPNSVGGAVTAGGTGPSFSGPSLPRVPGVHDYNRPHSFSTPYTPWQQYPQRSYFPPSDSSIKPEINPLHRPSSSYPGLAGSIPEAAYERHSSQASSAGHGTSTQTNSPLPPGMAYPGGPSQHGQSEPYPASSADSHDAYTRHVLTLQTAQLPPPPEYQVSPFTPSYNFDTFYHYAHENSSAVSLPASYMRSHGYESPSGYAYETHDVNRLAASNPGGAR